MLKRRPRKFIEFNDLERDPDETMLMLISLKNDNRSWRMIADSLSTEYRHISAALVHKVAHGVCKSPKVEMALGLRDEIVMVPTPIARYKRTFKKRKSPARKRRRLTIECTDSPELADEFHANAQARGMTPVQYQRHLLDLDAGIGELP